MEITRELDLDVPVEDVWRLLTDPDELADWVGEEVRGAPVTRDPDQRRVSWTWSPDGVESIVELTVIEDGERSRVQVTERTSGSPTASARACSLSRWDGALLALEWRARTWTHRLVAA